MTELTELQASLLTEIAASPDRTLIAPQNTGRTVAGLIKRGYVIALPQPQGPSKLMITTEGSAAVGGETASNATEAPAGQPIDDKPADPPTEPSSNAIAKPTTKLVVLVDLLRRPEGVSIEEMMQKTGWQAHSVRGAISGALKKGMGLDVRSEKTDAGRRYRIPGIAEGDA